MKRLLTIASLVLAITSCNNSGGSATDRLKDSMDSLKNLKIESIDEAAEAAKDTIRERHDSMNEMIDSVSGKATDSLNQIKK